METDARLLLDTRCRLGEGVTWDEARGRLLFVDILQARIHAFDPATGAHHAWKVPQKVGWLVPTREPGTWLAGLQGGVARVRLEDGADEVSGLAWLQRLHDEASPLRLNDAKADAAGRLWFGTMDGVDEERPVGRLLRLSPGDAAPVPVDEGYRVTNGPTFSLDGRTLYHSDSAARTVFAFDVDAEGRLSNKRTWLKVEGDPAENGYPDGMTTDAEGRLWIARWGAGCVVQHAPDGRELRRVRTGAPHTTNVAFGGPGLHDLYITTARKDLADDVADRTRSGALFVLEGAGTGRPPCRWGG